MDHKEELDRYYKEIEDKNIYKFTIEEAREYYRMRLRQMGRFAPAHNPKRVIAQAYLQAFSFQKGIEPEQPIELPKDIQEMIYELYHSGALPMRLGGMDKELLETIDPS
jgi:hypothetical protein